ncbi:hypothetical protein CPB86DRAFT_784860 [Serendipita vermifera]|nr:hypothetical protein CPB86DRAFT_784860 [Serendipita vermifera]
MPSLCQSAVRRVPQEIWWIILDEVIAVPLVFDVTYEGESWAKDSKGSSMRRKENTSYAASENQRKVIGSVCRLWQLFAISRKDRCVTLNENWRQEIKRSSKARHVAVCDNTLDRTFLLDSTQGAGVNCEILRIDHLSAVEFASFIPHPRLRRLHLSITDRLTFHFEKLLDLLGMFTNLTWLHCSTNVPGFLSAKGCTPVTLANLQVLVYECEEAFNFPLSDILLPSLQYLTIHFSQSLDKVPINDLVMTYCQTVRSIVLKGDSGGREDTIHYNFPSWDNFPRLEELVLHYKWHVQFEAMLPDHSLRTLEATHDTFDTTFVQFDSLWDKPQTVETTPVEAFT